MTNVTCVSGKDVLRTDRDLPMYNNTSSAKLVQLEHILRTYVMYNFDLGELWHNVGVSVMILYRWYSTCGWFGNWKFIVGYVQGMSDLLAPLLVVMETEVDTFWCFAGFMEMVVCLMFVQIILRVVMFLEWHHRYVIVVEAKAWPHQSL